MGDHGEHAGRYRQAQRCLQVAPAQVLPSLAGAVCGVWLLSRPRSAALAPVWIYTAVTAVWALLGVQAHLRGLPVVKNRVAFWRGAEVQVVADEPTGGAGVSR